MQCVHCGAVTTNPKFCSNACQKAFEWAARRVEIEARGRIPNGSVRAARRYIAQQQGRRCDICGGVKWRGQSIPLVLDHINGDSADWRIDNLRFICANCDAQLPTFKSRNRGRGRAKRRARYAAGKSY